MGGVQMLGGSLIAIILICCPVGAFSQDRPLSRIKLPFDPVKTEVSGIGVSCDGRSIFFATAEKVDPTTVRRAYLVAYDVSDMTRPQLAAQIALGDVRPEAMSVRNGRLFLLYEDQTGSSSTRVAVFDMRDVREPEKLSDTDVSGYWLQFSRDGTLSGTEIHEPRIKLAIGPPVTADMCHIRPPDRAEPEAELFEWRAIGSDRPRVLGLPNVFDRDWDRALTVSGSTARIWDISELYHPQLKRVLYQPSVQNILEARFLPGRDALMIWSFDELQIISSAPLGVTAAGIREVHRSLLEQINEGPRIFDKLASALAAAGVEKLIDRDIPGLHLKERVALLADYGYWADSVPALEKVVELEPTRTESWLHLADAARWGVAQASTYSQKVELSQAALRAYAAYLKRSGKDAPGAAEFRALNVMTASKSDVCSYVAAFYSVPRGSEREREIRVDPAAVDITNDGRFVRFTATIEGTAAYATIYSEDADLKFFAPDPESSHANLDDVLIVPFGEKNYIVYVVDGGPIEVALANVGTVCRYDRQFTPVLTEGKGRALCMTFARSKELNQAPTTPVSIPSQFLGQQPLPAEAIFLAATQISASKNHPSTRLGSYHAEWSGGRGCSFDGIAFLDGDRLEESPRQATLEKLQSELGVCDGGKGFVVQVSGQTLIELDGAISYQRPTPPRALIAPVEDRLETICKVEQRMSYAITRPMQ